jgi:bifunctional non-homologous end joining protein LigD
MAKGPKQRLKQYRAKRDFSSTPEPSGDEKPRDTVKRSKKERFFCVQKHLASHLHYDFRLEHDGVLLSWAVPKGPSLNPRDKRLAMRVEDHPFDYGEFEGVIPEGYGAGIVMLWDRGTWRPKAEDVDAALEDGEVKFTLDGVKLKGEWLLVRTGDGRSWLLMKKKDEWSGDLDITEFAPKSVKSDGDLADILAAEDVRTWESHLPARGGATGAMLRQIVEEAAKKKLAAEKRGGRKRAGKAAATKSRAKKRPRAGARGR